MSCYDTGQTAALHSRQAIANQYRMDLKHIETFFWVAHLGSVTAAAERLNTTQPAISQRIRAFEHSLGVPLFTRRKKRLSLTSRGQDLLAHARQIINIVDQIELDMGFPRKKMRLIRLGATDMNCLLWLNDFVAGLSRAHPEFTWEIITDLTINLRRLLLEGKIDFAVLAGPVPNAQFSNYPLGTIEMKWVASHLLHNESDPLSPKELAQMPILSHTTGSDLYCLMEEWFAEEGIEPPRFHRCNALPTMIQLLRSGLGATVLPTALIDSGVADSKLQVLNVAKPFPKLGFFAAYPKNLFAPLAQTITHYASDKARKYFDAP